MSKPKRKQISEKIASSSFYDILDGKTPEQAMETLRLIQCEYQGRQIYFDITSYGYDGGIELDIWETRLENDKEFAKRREAEAKDREKEKLRKRTNLEKEFAEYQRLQKKFQGKSAFN